MADITGAQSDYPPPASRTDEKTNSAKADVREINVNESVLDLFDTIDIATLQIAPNYRIVKLNQKAKDIYGENVLGAFCYQMAAKRDAVCGDCPAKEVFEGKQSGRSEHMRTTVSGEEICIDHIATPIKDANGHILGALILAIDITKRKCQEKELLARRNELAKLVEKRTQEVKEREEELERTIVELEAIVDALPGMVSVVDREFTTIIANSAVIEKFGNSDKSEVLGKKCHKVRKGLEEACPQCAILQAFETGELVSRVSTPEEEALMGVSTKSYAIPLKDESESIWGGVEVIMDITDMKHNEQTLKENEARLQQEINRRKSIENDLRKSEERLDLALSAANEGIWDWDIKHGTFHFDSRYYTISGYEPYEFPSAFEEWEKRVHPGDIQQTKSAISQYLSGDTDSYDVEFRFLRKDGDYMWIQGKGKIVARDDQGNPARFIGTHADITDRKRLDDSLRITQFAFDKAAIGIYWIGADAKILDVNEKAARILGYTKEELQSLTIFDIDPSVDRESWGPIWQTLREKGQDHFETMHCTKDGRAIPVEINSNLLEYNGQRYSIAFSQDITQRKQDTEALMESERRYRATFEAMPDSVSISRVTDGRFFYVNHGFCHVTGYSRDEAINKTAEELNLYVDAQDREEMVQLLEINGELLNYEVQLLTKDGTPFDAFLSARLISIDGEDCLVALVKDVTDIKRSEEEKARLRTQLRQAEKMEAIGTLAGGIAHDFNNILTAIIGNSELLQLALPKDDKNQARVDQIFKAGMRAREMVQQILTFSRKTEQEVKPLQVDLIVSEALKLLRATLPSSIEIESRLDSNSLILGDPTQIHQVVMNLCTNAGHAMEDGVGRLMVELQDVEVDESTAAIHFDVEPGTYLNLVISDTGCGMEPDVLNRAFDPFFTTKNKGEGTGMGLSVVHGIVTGLGGMIHAYSEPGQGSTFGVYLPVHQDGGKETREEDTNPLEHTGKGGVLVVDDEEAIAQVAHEMLTMLGYEVEAKTDSTEALEYFQQNPHRFDLLLTDMTMPGMTGDVLAKHIHDIRPDLPIVLATGFSAHLDNNKIRDLGIRALISKPFNMSQLAKAISQALESKLIN